MKKILLFCFSFLLVAFSQPVWGKILGPIASIFGIAFFFYLLLDKTPKKRFFLGTCWFTIVQLIQLSWFISHPFAYIYSVWIGVSLWLGSQFGILSLFVTKQNLQKTSRILALCAGWVLLEWSRLFLLSGLAFNPIGLSLAGNHISLQTASLFGVYGLSFLVMLTNFLFLKVLIGFRSKKLIASLVAVALFPYLFGSWQLALQEKQKPETQLTAILVQPNFPVEEILTFPDADSYVRYVMNEWKSILIELNKHQTKTVDLIALPEFVVPFGTYTFLYPLEDVKQVFEEVFGNADSLPALIPQFAQEREGLKVNNAFWAQAIANIFSSDLAVGLEDVERDHTGEYHYYSAAFVFRPQENVRFPLERYEKRVLVPMGEYIPFSFCRKWAQSYGVFGQFTHGKEAKVFSGKAPFGLCICYEEMYGHMMHQNSLKGAKLLVNLSNDGWYPDSKLAKQHLEHARLRTVENGIPLLRACNTGITCAIDSFGRTVSELPEEVTDSLLVTLPIQNFPTPYALFGDTVIMGFCLLLVSLEIARKRRHP